MWPAVPTITCFMLAPESYRPTGIRRAATRGAPRRLTNRGNLRGLLIIVVPLDVHLTTGLKLDFREVRVHLINGHT